MAKITVKDTEITVISKPDSNKYICITDIARFKNPIEPKDVVKNWLRNRTTIEFLGLWEKINNPDFKGVEFDPLLFEAGTNAFTMSPTRWVAHYKCYRHLYKNRFRRRHLRTRRYCFSNMENINAVLISDNVPQSERLLKLNATAIQQMRVLQDNENRKMLK